MSVSYDSFLPDVLPYVHDCPEIVARQAIKNACIEFCEKTHWWVYEHDPITALADVGAYELDLPSGTTIARITAAVFDGLQLQPRSEAQLEQIYAIDWRTQSGRPQFYTMLPGAADLRIVPAPQTRSVGALKLIVALRPTRASTTVDDEIYERWAEVIGYGARARLCATVGQPYYDAAAALTYAAMFRTGVSEAHRERNRGQTQAVLYARPPRFF